MNDLDQPPLLKGPPPPAPDRDTASPPPNAAKSHRRSGRRLLGLGPLVLFVSALGLGVWWHYQQHRQVIDTAGQQANFVPSVHVEKVVPRLGRLHVTLPATTLGFVEANIYARASGYVAKRYVDIGDHVKSGQLLAEITAPEVEDQVAQYQNSLQQAQATIHQNEAQRASTDVTSRRISVLANDGWATREQGDTTWYSFQAQKHATTAAEYNAAATGAAATVLQSAKDLSTDRGPVRWGDHAAQHRCRQPDHGRRDGRHRDVCNDPQRRDPGLGLRPAGRRLWRQARRRGRHPRARDA